MEFSAQSDISRFVTVNRGKPYDATITTYERRLVH